MKKLRRSKFQAYLDYDSIGFWGHTISEYRAFLPGWNQRHKILKCQLRSHLAMRHSCDLESMDKIITHHQHTFDELMLILHMQTRVGINNRNSQVPKISWYTWLKSSRKELRYDTIRFISDNITMSTIMKKRTATPKKRENKSKNKSKEQFDQDCQPHVCSGTFDINMYGVHHLP